MTILLVERHGSAVHLVLNRPEVRNALSSELAEAAAAELAAAIADETCRCVVIRGAGGSFSAGTDLKERRTLDADGKWAQSRRLWALVRSILDSPKPVVAAIDGWCLGGGFELALACDLRIATEAAVFGFPEMTLGAYPGGGGAVLLPRLVGIAAAKRLLFAERRIKGREAQAIGVVDWLEPDAGGMDLRIGQVAAEIEARSPLALRALKPVLRGALDLPLDEAFAFDMEHRRPLEGTRDYQEGLAAFFEKRAPRFTGR
jgi:enoyl-CoA hydratase/carnithine racemase